MVMQVILGLSRGTLVLHVWVEVEESIGNKASVDHDEGV